MTPRMPSQQSAARPAQPVAEAAGSLDAQHHTAWIRPRAAKPASKDTAVKVIDFRFRPNTPDAIEGMLSPANIFSGMFRHFRFAERAYALTLETIVSEMDALGVEKGVITSRDAETTYGAPSGNKKQTQ